MNIKKNGFTLIELLAVILILGVIALIAIPTVTGIIEDSKMQSYVRSAEGLLSSIDNKCNIDMLKGVSVHTAYNFGKSKLLNNELEIKGELPKEGRVRINDDCEILMAVTYDHYCLTKKFDDEKITITELGDSKCSLPGTKNKLKNHISYISGTYSLTKTEYMDDLYREKIISINYLYSNIVPNNIASGPWDLSQANDNSIKGYLLANGENYDLYIISENTILYDTSNNMRTLYSWFFKPENINFYNFDTSIATNFRDMFNGYTGVSLDLTGYDTSNVITMQTMFWNANKLEKLDLSSFDTSKVSGTGMTAMFHYCKSLKELDVSSFNTSKISNMRRLFSDCYALTSLDLSSFDLKSADNISEMFAYSHVLDTVYVGNKWNIKEGINVENMCLSTRIYDDDNDICVFTSKN